MIRVFASLMLALMVGGCSLFKTSVVTPTGTPAQTPATINAVASPSVTAGPSIVVWARDTHGVVTPVDDATLQHACAVATNAPACSSGHFLMLTKPPHGTFCCHGAPVAGAVQ